eukprot:scaffold479727_cov15-Prasinocladus_malaysianus.AAC.1
MFFENDGGQCSTIMATMVFQQSICAVILVLVQSGREHAHKYLVLVRVLGVYEAGELDEWTAPDISAKDSEKIHQFNHD